MTEKSLFGPSHFILDQNHNGITDSDDAVSLGGLSKFIAGKKEKAAEICLNYQQSVASSSEVLESSLNAKLSSYMDIFNKFEEDLNAATEIFTQSAALGIQDNFSEINKAWAAVETLCVRRFESLQSLNKEIETVEENFTSAINESMDKLTLEVAALELVDKPSIMEFAQDELTGRWESHVNFLSKIVTFIDEANRSFELEYEDYAKLYMKTLLLWKDQRVERILENLQTNLKSVNDQSLSERLALKERISEKQKDLCAQIESEYAKIVGEDTRFPIITESIIKFQDFCTNCLNEYSKISNEIRSDYQNIIESTGTGYENLQSTCMADLRAIGIFNEEMISKIINYLCHTLNIVESLKAERDETEADIMCHFSSLNSVISNVIGSTLCASYFESNLKGDMDTFKAQSSKAMEELQSKHSNNMSELQALLMTLICKMDTEVDYEVLESSFEEADKILHEMHDFTQNYQKAAFGYMDMIPSQNTVLSNTFRDKVSTFLGVSTKKPIKDDIVSEEQPSDLNKSEPPSRAQSASTRKKSVFISLPEGKEDIDLITCKSTGAIYYIQQKDSEIDWLSQRTSEWIKFKDSKQESKKQRKFNTFWYNTKRSKDKNRSAAYSVLVSGAMTSDSSEKDHHDKEHELFEKMGNGGNKSLTSSANGNAINTELLETAKKLVQSLRRRVLDSFESWSKTEREILTAKMNDLKRDVNADVEKQVQERIAKVSLIEHEIYERRSDELMSYRRAFENLDRTVRKKLEGLNEERENVIHDLDLMCKGFYEKIGEFEREIESLNSMSDFEKVKKSCEKIQQDFRKDITKALDHQLRKILVKIKALDKHFKDDALSLRMLTSYDGGYKVRKAPLYQNLIDTLKIVTRDCEKKFIDDFKHWQENAITETKTWVDKYTTKLNKKRGYLELMEVIEKSSKQSKMNMRALKLKCETLKSEIIKSLEQIYNNLETLNIESISELQTLILESLRSAANKIISLGHLVVMPELESSPEIEKIPNLEAWIQSQVEDPPSDTAKQSKKEPSIIFIHNQHIKKLETDLLKQVTVYLEQKKANELSNIPKYQRSLYDSQYEQSVSPIRAKIKGIMEEHRLFFENSMANFRNDMSVIFEMFDKISRPIVSLVFEKLPLLHLSSNTTEFLAVFQTLKESEESSNTLMMRHKQMLKVNLGHPNAVKDLEKLMSMDNERSSALNGSIEESIKNLKDVALKCSNSIEDRGLFYLFVLVKISSRVLGKRGSRSGNESGEENDGGEYPSVADTKIQVLELKNKHGVKAQAISEYFDAATPLHGFLLQAYLNSIGSINSEILKFEKLLKKKTDVIKRSEERWLEFWTNGIKRIKSIN